MYPPKRQTHMGDVIMPDSCLFVKAERLQVVFNPVHGPLDCARDSPDQVKSLDEQEGGKASQDQPGL